MKLTNLKKSLRVLPDNLVPSLSLCHYFAICVIALSTGYNVRDLTLNFCNFANNKDSLSMLAVSDIIFNATISRSEN